MPSHVQGLSGGHAPLVHGWWHDRLVIAGSNKQVLTALYLWCIGLALDDHASTQADGPEAAACCMVKPSKASLHKFTCRLSHHSPDSAQYAGPVVQPAGGLRAAAASC